MSYAIRQNDEICVIDVNTSLDAIGVVEMSGPLLAVADASPDVIEVNLDGVGFLDPSGLGLLVALKKRQLAKRGEFRICGLKGQPAAFIRNLKLEAAFGVRTTAAEEKSQRGRRTFNTRIPSGARQEASVVLAA